MDITLITVIGLGVVVLVAIIFGIKKVLDSVVLSATKQEKTIEALQEEVSQSKEFIKALIEEKYTELNKNISSFKNDTSQQLSTVNKETSQVLVDRFQKMEAINISMQKLISESSEKIISDLKGETQSSSENISNRLSENTTQINNKLDRFLETQDKNILNIKAKIDSSYTSMVYLVNNLRLDNLINVSNEIGKYKQGVYEDDHFLQEVGYCKIIKLIDKNTKEVTQVYYNENGEKSYTETFDNETLKYKMKYENGKLRNGIEFNKNGEIIFEYFYDEAEEISKKIEYLYDESHKLKDTIEINY